MRGPYAEEDAATAHRYFTIITQVPPHSSQIFVPLSCILHPALGSFALLPPMDNGVSTEQVLGKGDVNTLLAFPSSPYFRKQTVFQKPRSFCSCSKDALQIQHVSVVALLDVDRESCSCLLQLVLVHLSRFSPRVLYLCSCHEG